MNERILRVLEFHKIIDRLNNETATSLGKDLTSKLKPSTNLSEVQQMQLETDEAANVLRLNRVIPLGGIFDIRESLKRSVIGGALTANECLDVASTIYGGRQVKRFVEELEEAFLILNGLIDCISPLWELEQHIKNCIDDHGYVLDSASVKLRSIRSSIRTNEFRIRERLDNYIKTKSNMLQDSIITIRNDRYVLPVKHEYRGSIGGIVHDQSASGQTLFMEPRAVVDLNNDLQEAFLKEQQEIDTILRMLSENIASQETYLQENVAVLAKVDYMFARAKLGKGMKASKPEMNDNGIIKMQQARHPLIPMDEVVANDVEIGESFTAIVITGPNTGGKTVTLKMIGLCTLMAQSGLQIPAFDGCELAVFDQVFADIGDEQSIEQNLSTFSSHMTNIVDIIKYIDYKTLVLFDELGSGTDPQEGAALAMSILDEVVTRGARIIATTHYPELKAYGYNRENVINASVEFNVETLQPTYRLLIGVPGRSNAFEISKRLGLDDAIIERARGHIGIDSKSVENMIESLEKSTRNAEKDYEEAHQTLLNSEKLRHEIEEEWKQFDLKRENLYKKAEKKAEKAIQNARDEAELIVAEIRNMKANATLKEHEWIEAKKMLEDASPNISSKQDTTIKRTTGLEEDLCSGDDIKLLTVNQAGTVLEKIGQNNYLIQVGMMKVKVKRSEIQVIKKEKQSSQKHIATVQGSDYHVGTELDLRGQRFEDALLKLEKYVDDVLLAGYSKVSIIHGKGTGALRKGVQQFVTKHPHISTFRLGTMSEGGSGVTVIEFN